MSAGSSISPASEQAHHGHVAEVLDVHRAATREVEQPLDALRGTPPLVRAPVVGLALGPHERRAARGTGRRHLPAPGTLLPFREHRADDLGDHVSGTSDDHRVALADVLAPHLLLVVQRGVGDRDASDEHGVEHGERRDLARAPRMDVDLLQQRRALLGRELVRDRPARRVARGAQLALQIGLVDLDHRAVDLPVDRVAVRLPVLQERLDAIDRVAGLGGRRDGQPGLSRPVEESEVRVERDADGVAERVDP